MPPLRASLIADFTPEIGADTLVTIQASAAGELCALFAVNSEDLRPSGRRRAQPEEQRQHRVVLWTDGATRATEPLGPLGPLHYVQSLSEGRLLLVRARCNYMGPSRSDFNGFLLDSDGAVIERLLLGDGIASVQACSADTIWTSYFDEGVFGNRGWSQPIGACGLRSWGLDGAARLCFDPGAEIEALADCYALNVSSARSTWLYGYPGFELAHLRDGRLEEHWGIPLSGCHAFAVSPGFALFAGGYDDRRSLTLFELPVDGDPPILLACFEPLDERGEPLNSEQVTGRGDALWLRRGARMFRCSVSDALARWA